MVDTSIEFEDKSRPILEEFDTFLASVVERAAANQDNVEQSIMGSS
jgi:hypothetical protein